MERNGEKRMEERDSCAVITFMNNTPSGIDWTRIVLTTSTEVGQLRGGSAHFHDPEKYVCPSWLSLKKATAIWKLHTGKNKEFTSKEHLKVVFWKYFKKKAVKPIYEDFSPHYLKRIGEWKDDDESKNLNPVGADMTEQVTKRKRVTIPSDAKIGATGKQPKSEKNIARLKLYRRTKLSSILEKNPEVTLADIKYDIKCGYAEIVG